MCLIHTYIQTQWFCIWVLELDYLYSYQDSPVLSKVISVSIYVDIEIEAVAYIYHKIAVKIK